MSLTAAIGTTVRELALAMTAIALPVLLVTAPVRAADLPDCVYVSSYHPEFSWSERIESSLREALAPRCTVTTTYMDSKRRRDPADIQAAALEALALIERLDPAVVITSDDNAAKYLIVPYLADTDMPVVFNGLNWTVEEYGFPRKNVTGMVEVAPLRPLIREAIQLVPGASRAGYISSNFLSARKNFERLEKVALAAGVELFPILPNNMAELESGFQTAQQYDFVIIGNFIGMPDWDPDRALRIATEHTRTLSLTTHDWMMPYTILGYTKVPEEQGYWAAATTIAVLEGSSPADIPLVTNRQWDNWVNADLLARSGLTLPAKRLLKAKQYSSQIAER